MPYKNAEDKKAHHKKYMRERWYPANKDKHMSLVAKNKKRNLKKVEWLNQYKAGCGCLKCPEKDPVCLEFHHRDPSTKEFELSSVRSHGYSMARLLAEIQKCDILCCNCHKKEHRKMAACSSESGSLISSTA